MEEMLYSLILSRLEEVSSEAALYLNERSDSEVQMQLHAPAAASRTPEEMLKTVFGYDSFRPMQKSVIENVLQGRDTLAIMPTGGGKSICYQIPALMMDGMTVVVSPLIALMKDQMNQLEGYGVSVACLNSTMDWNTYRKTCMKIKEGSIKVLYVSPEKLNTDRMVDVLKSTRISCFAVDEAHCVSEWGHDFRPDYMEIARVKRLFPKAVCLALTATATQQVQEDIVRNLEMEIPDILVSSFNRPNIYLHVKEKDKALDQIMEIIEKHSGESGIIYCSSRKDVDTLTESISRRGIRAISYHAGLDSGKRASNQDDFINSRIDVIVATVAFGMGINKPDVRFVIHHTMPKSIEQYYQEIGRAGRDGLPAEAVLLYSQADIRKLRFILNGSSDQAKAEKLLKGMCDYATSEECRRKVLLSYFGEKKIFDSTASVPKDKCCDICGELEWKSESLPLKATARAKVISFPKKKVAAAKNNADTATVQKLKAWRKKAAEELNVPPYIIFGDRTINDIVEKMPETKSELLECYGIGTAKADKFGAVVLKIINS